MPARSPHVPPPDPLGPFGRALLDALPASTAVVDREGTIIATNAGWQAVRWPAVAADLDVQEGENLLARLRASAASPAWHEAALQLADGLERLLAGEATTWGSVIDGAGPIAESWHTVQVLPLAIPGGGAVITVTEVTEQVRAERRLEWQATHDRLTGLVNRAQLVDTLQQALRRGATTVVLTDLDRFTVLNDSLGPDLGDCVLREVAARLETLVAPDQTLARMAGDSFAIVLAGADQAIVDALIARIDEALRTPFELADRQVLITTSTGAVLVTSELTTARRAEDVLREAESALRRAQVDGRPRCLVLEASVLGRSSDALDTEQDLRRALERGEFHLEYQPEVSVETGQVLGAEALLRWHHPTRGVLVPNEFLALAEETGLIVSIGHWTVLQACRDAAGWFGVATPDATGTAGSDGGGPSAPDGIDDDVPVFVGVNLSARQIADPALLSVVDEALAATGLPPTRLCVEITENVLFEDFDESVTKLRALRERGVRIALDDFGTGYSSLSYLKELPVDVLKIDRSFVDRLDRDQRDQAVVAAVVTLARVFGLQVVAEGVEGADQLARLRSLGVHVAQGFDVARPSDSDTMATLAREGLRPGD